MQVSKWGNSLAIRLPQAVVEALQLKEGDEIEISVGGTREFAVDRDRRRARSCFGHAAAIWGRAADGGGGGWASYAHFLPSTNYDIKPCVPRRGRRSTDLLAGSA